MLKYGTGVNYIDRIIRQVVLGGLIILDETNFFTIEVKIFGEEL
mgnify:CR=1 FL=1